MQPQSVSSQNPLFTVIVHSVAGTHPTNHVHTVQLNESRSKRKQQGTEGEKHRASPFGHSIVWKGRAAGVSVMESVGLSEGVGEGGCVG